MKAVLPESFDLDIHIALFPPEETGLIKFSTDKALYILSQIILVPSRNRAVADNMKEGYTPLNSTLLQSFAHDYKSYLDYFIQTGVIECDGKYWPTEHEVKGKSKGYRFCKKFNSSTQLIAYSASFRKKLVKKRREEYNELKEEYYHLTKWLFPNCGLQIDEKTALRFLEIRKNAQLKHKELQDIKKHPLLNLVETKDPTVQYHLGKASIEAIRIGDIGCTVDKTVGRMHTVLTNMKSDLRNLITYQNQPLVSLDITNSQPYISTILFNTKSKSVTNATHTTINKTIKQIHKQLQTQHTHIYTLMLEELIQVIDNEDFIYFKKLVSNSDEIQNDIYEYILHQYKEETNKHPQKKKLKGIENRRDAKELMFEMLFAKVRGTKNQLLFSKLFPSVFKVFKVIKSTDYRVLSHWLQQIEAHLMLKVITKEVAKKYPKMPLFTIHDSIVIPVGYEEGVQEIMQTILMQVTSLPPKIKRDYWKPECIDWERYASR